MYSSVFGDVELVKVSKNEEDAFPIEVKRSDGSPASFMKDGKFYFGYGGECTLFPSRDQRDWSKFTAPWLKKEKFDPKTLQPYDKVLVRDCDAYMWKPTFLSYINNAIIYPYVCGYSAYRYCIPYNDDTKYLVGTTDEAPEYYRYWED